MKAVDDVLAILQHSEEAEYFGEAVSQLQHALQAAHSAELAHADEELIIAALLHDIGHLITAPDSGRDSEVGVIDHDHAGAEFLRQHGFSDRVTKLVNGHVDAKRYLTATNPDYVARLSPASTRTLLLQGGPMSSEQADNFRTDPLFRDKLQLRSWDEQAKNPNAIVPPLAHYRAMLERHFSR
ncbi:MAG: HDIG domain-containing protein [Bryobacteraceae bacterium]|nr:HDIG domain-containing protein [Bryobacteraceae bacterium]